MEDATYLNRLVAHYESVWRSEATRLGWHQGPVSDLSAEFCILEFGPRADRAMWTYATCCMSSSLDQKPLELHLFSPTQSEQHVELLTAIAHYHRTGERLGLGHTVNFGRPWLDASPCQFGLISLPFLDGSQLEWLTLDDGHRVRLLWLVPITSAEVAFKKAHGQEALEEQFEAASLNYLDPQRPSVV